jgi:NTE family protein
MTDNKYDYLVFSGGSIKGIAFLGALQVLLEHKIINSNIKGYAGTSAGSIIASLLAIGLSYDQIQKYMTDLDISKIPDDKIGFIRDTENFINNYGVCKGNYLYKYLGNIIKTKCGDKNYTIKQLFDNTGIKLVIPVTDMNKKETVYLHPHNLIDAYKNIPIRLAVRMSTSVPFMFEPIKYNNSLFVDGGVIDNYPINVFDGEESELGSLDQCLGLCKPNDKVLGLKLITKIEPNEWTEITSVTNFGLQIIDLFLTDNDRKSYTKINKKRTINIMTESYSLTDFTMDLRRESDLINAGIRAGFKFIEN